MGHSKTRELGARAAALAAALTAVISGSTAVAQSSPAQAIAEVKAKHAFAFYCRGDDFLSPIFIAPTPQYSAENDDLIFTAAYNLKGRWDKCWSADGEAATELVYKWFTIRADPVRGPDPSGVKPGVVVLSRDFATAWPGLWPRYMVCVNVKKWDGPLYGFPVVKATSAKAWDAINTAAVKFWSQDGRQSGSCASFSSEKEASSQLDLEAKYSRDGYVAVDWDGAVLATLSAKPASKAPATGLTITDDTETPKAQARATSAKQKVEASERKAAAQKAADQKAQAKLRAKDAAATAEARRRQAAKKAACAARGDKVCASGKSQ